MEQRIAKCPQGGCQRPHYAIAAGLPPGVSQMLATRVIDHYECGDMDQAENLAEFLIRAVRDRSEVRWSMYAQTIMAMVLHAKEHINEALELYKQVITFTSKNGATDLYWDEYLDALYGAALCHYDLGDMNTFKRTVDLFSGLSSRSCSCFFQIRKLMLQGLLAVQRQQYMQAQQCFQQIGEYRTVSWFYYTVSLLMLTEIAGLQHETNTALKFLSQADHLLHSRYWGALLAWRMRLPTTLALADQYDYHDWPAKPRPMLYLGDTIQLARPQSEIELHIFGNGSLRVWHDKRQDWRHSNTLAVLLSFIAMNPHGVSAEKIKMHLWPGSTSRDALHRAVSDLRDFLGGTSEHPLITNQNGIYRLTESVWVDVIEYERLYEQARMAESLYDQYGAYRRVAQLYQGDFLDGIEKNAWVAENRARYRNYQAWLCVTLASIHHEQGEYHEANYFLDEALYVNPRFDPAVEQKIRLYDQLSQRSEAVELYHTYENRIMMELGVKPAPSIARLIARMEAAPNGQVTSPFSEIHMRKASLGPRRMTPVPRLLQS